MLAPAGGTLPVVPGTTGVERVEARGGSVMALPSMPIRNAVEGLTPLLPRQSTAVAALSPGP